MDGLASALTRSEGGRMANDVGGAPEWSRRLVEEQMNESGLDLEANTALERFVALVRREYENADAALNEARESLDRSQLIKDLNLKLARKNDELKAALASQTRTQQMFATLASNSPLAIVYTDVDGRAMYSNDRTESLFDRPASDLLGFGWLHLIPEEQRDQFGLAIDGPVAENTVVEHEVMNRDGSRTWVSTTVAPVVHSGEVSGWIANVEDITERRENEVVLERLATTDSLTGLMNRYSFGRAVSERCSTLEPGEQFVLALIDLDRFKLVNDTFGHPVGDQLLVAVAGMLRAQAQPGDLIARLGGDEFACTRRTTNLAQAHEFGRSLSDALHQPVMVERQLLHTAASVGLAMVAEFDGEPEDLLRDADTAMYRAKTSSASRYEIFDQSFRREVMRRFALERELHDAVDNGDVKLAFQPIVDAVTQRVKVVEALARWSTPDLGEVGPLEFIETAEHLGLSRVLGRQILEMACKQLGDWVRERPHWRGMAVSVNVTYGQLIDEDFTELVRRTLAKNKLPASALILELTEQALLDDFDRSMLVLRRLRSMGVRIAIDDFGTGYSALSYLARLEVDFLKIDRSFVQRLSHVTDEGDNRLTEAIVNLALRFDLTPIAEGVETTEQMRILRQFGCELLQGYLFARPMWPTDSALIEVIDAGRRARSSDRDVLRADSTTHVTRW